MEGKAELCGFFTFKISKMTIIDLDEITKTMQPVKGSVLLTKYYNHPAIKCTAQPTDSQYEDERLFDEIKSAQKILVGDAFQEFFTETTLVEWYIFLKRIPIEFQSDDVSHAENWLEIHQPNITN